MILAGTGHRPNKLGGYAEQVNVKLRAVARVGIHRHAPTRIISGMALGWDMALAEAAVELGIPFTAAVPFAGQEKMWPAPSQERYRKLLEQAAHVETVCTGGYAAWKMQRRNEWMVDHCDLVLALWDGTEGGTGNCIRYAEQVERTYDNMWPVWQGVYK
jgi:uncharacterized phage-like protein YoqJ